MAPYDPTGETDFASLPFERMTQIARDGHREHMAVLNNIASAEGPNAAWLRSNAAAIAQIRRERLADEAARASQEMQS